MMQVSKLIKIVLSIHELIGNGNILQSKKRIMCDDIVEGEDILGVLLMGNEKGSYWYGSKLSIEDARKLAPNNSATTLQGTSIP
jgi:homospermidine synthase